MRFGSYVYVLRLFCWNLCTWKVYEKYTKCIRLYMHENFERIFAIIMTFLMDLNFIYDLNPVWCIRFVCVLYAFCMRFFTFVCVLYTFLNFAMNVYVCIRFRYFATFPLFCLKMNKCIRNVYYLEYWIKILYNIPYNFCVAISYAKRMQNVYHSVSKCSR